MKRYNPSEIEPKWQQIWQDQKVNEVVVDPDKQKIYVSGMFPYPSGAGMHTGHAFSWAIVDAIARFHRQHGRNVLNPMGWDTFGLPAENYAIKTGTAPAVVTAQNIANFKKQFKRMGTSIDWSRELNTSDPEYYRWTQWVFTKLFEKGLAYQKESLQWWCPVDKTVLANEQVEGGHCWRCGSEVEKKSMKQWFFKITDYAEQLLDEIPDLDWPQKIKTAQTNWIGKSQGAEIEFAVEANSQPNYLILHGFTGRADKNFIPWLKEQLEQTGAKVQAPQLPNTDNPTEQEQVGYVLDNCEIDENTIIIGHSLGGVVGMKVIEKLDHPVAGLVLAAPALEPAFRKVEDERNFWNTFNFDYNYEAIKDKTKYRIVLSDTLEADKRQSYLVYLKDKLNAAFYESAAEKNHFTGEKEPFILSHLAPIITVFSTRPDTLFGATFVVLAPEHPLVKQLAVGDFKEFVEKYVSAAVKKSEIERMNDTREKTGVFTGSYAINPATGEKVPIWVADYVLIGYGTGAIMAVPAHDERDFAFAEKYELPIIEVVEKPDDDEEVGIYHGEGPLVNSGRFDGKPSSDAREEIVAWLEQEGTGKSKTTYKMRDWLISRQRYWGAPIPIIHCDEHGAVAVPEDQLPVILPVIQDYAPKGDGLSALAAASEWVNTTCPTCGKPAKRETDTLDGYACSSWYLLRYGDPKNDKRAWDPETINYWNPVDYYVGGDHAVAHLLYVRFWTHVFHEMGLTDFKEPVKKLIYHGYVNAEDGTKMSKSKGNVIDPLDIIDQGYGADSLRTYLLFTGPLEIDAAWSSKGIAGVYRFLNRVWVLTQEYLESDKQFNGNDFAVIRAQHKTIRRVTDDFNRLSFNTAISALMEYTNELYKLKVDGFSDDVWHEALSSMIQLIAPFAPHLSEELNKELGSEILIQNTPWPVWNDSLIIDETITIIVQVNGKLRAKLNVSKDASEDEIKILALAEENVQTYVITKKPTKVIYVPGRLVSIVT